MRKGSRGIGVERKRVRIMTDKLEASVYVCAYLMYDGYDAYSAGVIRLTRYQLYRFQTPIYIYICTKKS